MVQSSNLHRRKVACKATNEKQEDLDEIENIFDKKEWKKNFASADCGAKLVRKFKILMFFKSNHDWQTRHDFQNIRRTFKQTSILNVIYRSSESIKHAHHLINRNEDEYLLYPCQDKPFFVIELCETIKVIR